MSRYLKVQVLNRPVDPAARQLAEVERNLRAFMKTIPHGTHLYPINRLRETLADRLRTLRATRGKGGGPNYFAWPLQFKLERRGFSEPVEYDATERAEMLRRIRANLRDTRARARFIPQQTLRRDGYPTRGVKLQPGMYLLAQKARASRVVFESKRPSSEDPSLGIELEFISPVHREVLGVAIAEAGLAKYVHLHSDGSVQESESRPGDPMEISLLVRQSELLDVVPRLTAILNAHKCYVNGTCGMHVHLDMRKRNAERAFSQLVRAQPILYSMCPKDRKASRFCRPTRGNKLQPHVRSGNRYKGINACALREHTTIEVRIHSGTLNAEKITNWVQLLLAIVDGTELKAHVRSAKSLALRLALPDALRDYMIARIEHFAAPTVPENPTAPVFEPAAA